ncbi:hypothetical protein AAFF_G00333610, partial [Aldrovandia affinis]
HEEVVEGHEEVVEGHTEVLEGHRDVVAGCPSGEAPRSFFLHGAASGKVPDLCGDGRPNRGSRPGGPDRGEAELDLQEGPYRTSLLALLKEAQQHRQLRTARARRPRDTESLSDKENQ